MRNDEIADSISQFLYNSKKFYRGILIGFISFFIFAISIVVYQASTNSRLTANSVAFQIFYLFFAVLSWIIATLWFLAFNRNILSYQLQSFETVYKLLNGVALIVLQFVRFESISEINVITVVDGISLLIGIIFVSCYDAWHVKYRVLKLFLQIGLILYVGSLYFQEYGSSSSGGSGTRDREKTIDVVVSDISVRTMILSIQLNLIIFYIRQLFHFVKDSDKATVIAIRPKIEWKNDVQKNVMRVISGSKL